MDKLRLIAEVRKRPILWDFENEKLKYPNRRNPRKADMWREVSASMGPDVSVEDCKFNWATLRNIYCREVKRIENRTANDIRKGFYDPEKRYGSKWVFFEQMKFLKRPRKKPPRRQFSQDISSSSGGSSDEDSDFEKLIQCKKLESKEDHKTSNQKAIEEIEKHTDVNPMTIAHKQPDNHIHKAEDRSLLQCNNLAAPTHSNDLISVEDYDYNFLVSFMPLMRRMNELQNLKFRAKLSEIMLDTICQHNA